MIVLFHISRGMLASAQSKYLYEESAGMARHISWSRYVRVPTFYFGPIRSPIKPIKVVQSLSARPDLTLFHNFTHDTFIDINISPYERPQIGLTPTAAQLSAQVQLGRSLSTPLSPTRRVLTHIHLSLPRASYMS